MVMRRVGALALALLVAGCVAAPTVLTSEPPPGTIAYGSRALVNDGSCPAGQIKELTGGSLQDHIPRKRRCITQAS
jgi:starvation-inducible outer membrane lipoprotein